MKKIILIYIIIFLLSVQVVDARWHKPRPVPTPTVRITPTPTIKVTPTPTRAVPPTPIPTPTNGKLCINYGHHLGPYDYSKIDAELNNIKNSNIDCVRIVYDGWNKPNVLTLVAYAKSKGLRVIMGGDWGTFNLSQSTDYRNQVLAQAVWAQQNGIDQMSLGNEQEYRLSGVTNAQWADYLESLATDVKGVYSGKVSYETSGDFATFWASRTLGHLDLIGFNLYCGYGCNLNYLQINISKHGVDHVYVSEVNADMDTGKYNVDSVHADRVKQDVLGLLPSGVPVYYFTYATCNNSGVANYWGIYQCGVLVQPLTAAALGIK